jgi:hypothetical protein
MKKMYIKPVIKEFQIVAQQTLMTGSTEQVYTEDFNSGTMTPLSRGGRGGFYDDEEE